MNFNESILDLLAEIIAEKVSQRFREPRAEKKKSTTPAPTPDPETVPEQVKSDPVLPLVTMPEPQPVKIEQLVLDLVRAVGRQRTVEILSQYGAKKASELAGDNLKGFIAFAQDEIKNPQKEAKHG